MNKNLILSFSVCSLIALSSCSSKLGALSKDNFQVTPTPLEVQGGKVTATIDGSFPEKYFKRKAVITITPELRYGNGMVAQGEPATFQGESVMGNYQTINYRLGGRYTMKSNFDYTDEMRKSDLYATFTAKVGKKSVTIPDVKIGYGVLATPELYRKTLLSDGGIIAPDSFERVKANKYEANIKFLINQANLRKSELKNNSVQEFVSLLKRINADKKGLNLKNVEVNAYASPEGGFEFNDKLATKRQNNSEAYVKQQLKKADMQNADVDAHYTAQDWEGFQKLVQASDIQDKEVILRVLSMYKDPEEREQQIRNMSEAFQELANGILPELRRSRLTINYETVGRTDDEIKSQLESDPTKLSADEMLYAASLEDNAAKKEDIYKKTAELYDRDYRAYNNLAVMEFNKGNYDKAQEYLNKAAALNKEGSEIYANEGLLALKDGKVSEAENLIGKASGSKGFNQAMGTLDIAKGNYAAASQALDGEYTNTAALSKILVKDYAGAKAILNKVKNPDGMTSYLHAVVSARQGNNFAAKSYLKEAIEKDASLQSLADNDLEFANIK
ncbi:MAG: tetratricopeptide repeat protein [Prevotella sp.]|jgi:tetratricopeptide (TPR) repeat protein